MGSEWMDTAKPVANYAVESRGGLAFGGLEDHSNSGALLCGV